MKVWLVLLLSLLPLVAAGDIVCDGDDVLFPVPVTNQFLSVSTGTMVVVVQPLGFPLTTSAAGTCYSAEVYISDGSAFLLLGRTPDFDGEDLDRLCASHSDAVAEAKIGASYTTDTFTHLTWQHSGGTLEFWQHGVSLGTVSTGDTGDALASPLHICGGGLPQGGRGTLALAEMYATAVPPTEIQAVGASRLHWLAASPATGRWELSDCAPGTSGDGISFADTSGNDRSATGSHGVDTSGLTCTGSSHMSWPWGIAD